MNLVNDYIYELETKLKLIDNKFGIIEDKVKEFLEHSVEEQFNKMATPAYKSSPTYEDKVVFLVILILVLLIYCLEKFEKESYCDFRLNLRYEEKKSF